MLRVIIGILLITPFLGCGGEQKSIVPNEPYVPRIVRVMGETLQVEEGDVPAAMAGDFTILEESGPFSVRIGEGKGLLHDTIVEGDILEGERLVRLVEALGETDVTWGIGLSRHAGLEVDGDTQQATVFGEGPVAILDLSNARIRERSDRFQNIRFSLLWPGDSYSFKEQLVVHIARPATGQVASPEERCDTISLMRGLLRKGIAVRDCSIGGKEERTHQIYMRKTEGTLIFNMPGANDSPQRYPTVSNARLDILPMGEAG